MVAPARPPLSPTTLDRLPAAVQRPAYRCEALATGIVHLGIGAFARAHLLPATDAAMAFAGDLRWGVCGVSLRSAEARDALAPQQGLYALALRDGSGHRLQVVGALRELLVAPENPPAVLQRLADPETRICSLTVTEKGYCLAGPGGGLDFGHEGIARDLASAQPHTAPGVIVRGLAQRRAAGHGGLTLLSLDNLAGNGEALARAVLGFADLVDSGLADWIRRRCSFPNSMVDRIVPRTTDSDREQLAEATGLADAWPVVAEPYFDWVVEDRFAAGRPGWEAAGAQLVADAAPYEAAKLRLVNGSHSALAYLGLLAGIGSVHEAMCRPALAGFVAALMREEVEPTLPLLPGRDLDEYRARLLDRYANPALQHRLAQIAMDGSQKIPQRWLATVRDRLAAGAPFPRLALAVAAWLRHLQGFDEEGRPIAVDDPLAAALAAEHARHGTMLGFAPVFGDLGREPRFVRAVESAVAGLRQQGALALAARMES